MLLFILACTGAPSDSGLLASPPQWQGTQIGEEGDETCALITTVWDSDQPLTDDGPTPAELRARIRFQGEALLESAWQGSAPLDIRLDADSGQILLIAEEDGCGTDQWLAVDTHVQLDAAPLLAVDTWLPLRSTALLLSLDSVNGALDPGTLPADATELQLTLHGDLADQGTLAWTLRTQGELELMSAGSWLTE